MQSFKNYRSVLLISLCLFISITSSHAAKKPIVCNNVYALCNAAACYQIPGIKNKAFCFCTVWKGKNVGYSSCAKRKPVKTPYDRTLLVSTFAFGGGHYKTNICPSGMPWASCLDQPCVRNVKNPRRAYCTCQILRNTPYLTFATRCKKKNCKQFIWSGASVSANTALVNALVKSLGYKKSPVQRCP